MMRFQVFSSHEGETMQNWYFLDQSFSPFLTKVSVIGCYLLWVNERLTDGDCVCSSGTLVYQVNGKAYHSDCFKCRGCNVLIGTKSLIMEADEIHCRNCFENSAAHQWMKCQHVSDQLLPAIIYLFIHCLVAFKINLLHLSCPFRKPRSEGFYGYVSDCRV